MVYQAYMTIAVYEYPACSTCKRALRWLDDRGVRYERIHIVDNPPDRSLLDEVRRRGVPLRAMFNVSGESYRKGNFKARLPTMSEADALDALARDGKLIKRPLVVGPTFALVGFDEVALDAALRDVKAK